MEKVQEQEQTIEVFENDIQMYLTMFCEENGIEDLKKESQSVWNAALMYIKRHVFNNNSVLKSSTPLSGYNNNNYNNQYSNLNNSNCNRYNIDTVNGICDYYIYMCYVYNKSISIQSFSRLTGINQDTIFDWGKNINKLSSSGCEIYKKLSIERESAWVAKLESMNHPTAIAILLNKQYGYNLPGVSKEQANKHALTADELPKLTGNDGAEQQKVIESVRENAKE